MKIIYLIIAIVTGNLFIIRFLQGDFVWAFLDLISMTVYAFLFADSFKVKNL